MADFPWGLSHHSASSGRMNYLKIINVIIGVGILAVVVRYADFKPKPRAG